MDLDAYRVANGSHGLKSEVAIKKFGSMSLKVSVPRRKESRGSVESVAATIA